MKCKNPYMYKGNIPFGCGQCMSCRKNKLRLWQHRLMLEGMSCSDSCMVTLTYSNEHLPPNSSLNPKDLQDFLKRLRRKIEPLKIRYFACGEYGETTKRPHYHVALFGVGKSFHQTILSAWGKGIIDTGYEGEAGKINKDSAQYICGYVTKKMTSWNDHKVKNELIKNGLHPEFARMSNRPGIGFAAVKKIVQTLDNEVGYAILDKVGDVPMTLKHGSKSWPLGRYLRSKIREGLGFEKIGAQDGWEEKALARAEEEMLQLCVEDGVIGLLKKEEETEENRVFKKIHGQDWKKALIRGRNIKLDEALIHKETHFKKSGRKL